MTFHVKRRRLVSIASRRVICTSVEVAGAVWREAG